MKKMDREEYYENVRKRKRLVNCCTAIFSILLFSPILVYVVITAGKPSILDTIKENRKKARAVSADELNSLPEMKMLQINGVPQSAIDAFIFNPEYDLNANIYPVSKGRVVIIKIGDAEYNHIYNDHFSSKDYVVTHIPVEGEDIPKISMRNEHLSTIDYEVVAEIYFFDLNPENYHEIYNIGSLEVQGSYKVSAPGGINAYSLIDFTMKRDNINVIVVSDEEMAALRELREMCSKGYCERK